MNGDNMKIKKIFNKYSMKWDRLITIDIDKNLYHEISITEYSVMDFIVHKKNEYSVMNFSIF